ncbi:uncharacterized protein BJ171DRAFT_441178, partial [Polychytrium aggregatum]|uniref:uncharacterized protein n=1 Tax=Polychytrium aggregatum TaxID=110093 RepID=UPI0022FDB7E3
MAASVHHSANMARPAINEHIPDIFTIICCNDGFQLALDLSTIKTLLRVCKRARPLLSSKVPHFHRWCQKAGLCRPDGQMRIGLTPSDKIALSLYCDDQATTDRSWLEDQADKGNAAASYLLARMLQSGIDSEAKDDSQTGDDDVDDGETDDDDEPIKNAKNQQIFQHLMKAAEGQHPMAQSHLAQCYRNGTGVEQDHTKATGLYRNLAERGILQAQIVFGGCYEVGEGVDQDYDAAIEWYSKAADQGSEDGRFHIVFLRGWRSFIGHGVEQSDADALNHWHEVSTQSTNPRDWLCKHLMAICLINGFGTPTNQTKAADIFEQLANDGHSDSQLWIGMCFYREWGVSEDHRKAFEWFTKSANQDNPYGQWWVGVCYLNGYGVTKDHAKAAKWSRISAEQGNRYGQDYLGNCYEFGLGVPEDIDTAVFWYRKSADQGHRDAIDRL